MSDLKLFAAYTEAARWFTVPAEPWMGDALCREVGGDIFYTDHQGEKVNVRHARRVCQMCPVSEACLQYALTHKEEFGVWGGRSPRERRRMLRGLPPVGSPAVSRANAGRNRLGHFIACKCSMCRHLKDAA